MLPTWHRCRQPAFGQHPASLSSIHVREAKLYRNCAWYQIGLKACMEERQCRAVHAVLFSLPGSFVSPEAKDQPMVLRGKTAAVRNNNCRREDTSIQIINTNDIKPALLTPLFFPRTCHPLNADHICFDTLVLNRTPRRTRVYSNEVQHCCNVFMPLGSA